MTSLIHEPRSSAHRAFPDFRFQIPYKETNKHEIASCQPDDLKLREALEAVGLSRLAGRLSEAGHWALQLSPGEQQRIAFARALVQKPDWLFLDEATSAVDEQTEARLYRLVRERLSGTTVFSVGHRATLRGSHARHLLVRANENGSSIVKVTAVPESARVNVAIPVRDKVAAIAG
jgi:ABC-type uncharacterized transport system fused permease/ATPase subunit